MDINTKMNTTTSYQKGDIDFLSRRNTTIFKPGTYNNTSIVEDNYQLQRCPSQPIYDQRYATISNSKNFDTKDSDFLKNSSQKLNEFNA